MSFEDEYCHSATIEVAAPAEQAFKYISDGSKQWYWIIGSADRKSAGDGLFTGRSMFNGASTYVRNRPDAERMIVLYDVGPSPEKLAPRNMVRVVPGPIVNKPAALDGIHRILVRNGADPKLIDVSRRDKPLPAFPPPGMVDVVQSLLGS